MLIYWCYNFCHIALTCIFSTWCHAKARSRSAGPTWNYYSLTKTQAGQQLKPLLGLGIYMIWLCVGTKTQQKNTLLDSHHMLHFETWQCSVVSLSIFVIYSEFSFCCSISISVSLSTEGSEVFDWAGNDLRVCSRTLRQGESIMKRHHNEDDFLHTSHQSASLEVWAVILE